MKAKSPQSRVSLAVLTTPDSIPNGVMSDASFPSYHMTFHA